MPTNRILNGTNGKAATAAAVASLDGGRKVFIASAFRTPIGNKDGALAKLKATDLAAIAIRRAYEEISLPGDAVEKVTVGQAIQAGSGQAPAKQALMKAGLPSNCRDMLINEVCSSGMQAVITSLKEIKLGANCLIAAGMESMSNVPKYQARVPKTEPPAPLVDGVILDGLTDSFNQCHMGHCAEHTAKKFSITRENQDEYAIESYRRAKVATEKGLLKREICPVSIPVVIGGGGANDDDGNGQPPILVNEDEEYKRLDVEKFLSLRPCFNRESGTITAGNASTLSDGAAACVLMSSEALEKYNVKPLAELVAYGEGACDPIDFATSPVDAIRDALHKAGLSQDDISLWEVNEAFSVVPLAIMKELQLDHSKVNVNGGGVSIGHPLGMSGIRVVNTLAHQLEPNQYGCAAICRGGGGSSAVIVRKL